MTILPPPFVEKFQYKPCQQVNDPVTRKRVYLTPDGERLPSVTTILSATKDMTHLNEWRDRIGHAKAQQITTEAAGVGTAMHGNLERFVCGMQRQPGNNPVHIQANKMADVIIENGLSKVNEIWAMEQSLYFPGLFSGTTDLVGVHEDEPAVMDSRLGMIQQLHQIDSQDQIIHGSLPPLLKLDSTLPHIAVALACQLLAQRHLIKR